MYFVQNHLLTNIVMANLADYYKWKSKREACVIFGKWSQIYYSAHCRLDWVWTTATVFSQFLRWEDHLSILW